jgi:hypothetical protein
VLGASVLQISGPLGIGLLIFGVIAALAAAVFLRRHEQALMGRPSVLSQVRSTAPALSRGRPNLLEQRQWIAFQL